ncbi:MAG: transposase [Bacteroidetes bacterium]|nr:transposase [Bacteroidota bacterium]MBU1579899.1 transposase [Bacteroidota bacterium]MBU2557777.1 transposase [Bacteroidota bacterium]
MQIEYHKWFSTSLQKDMELKIYGYYGKPILLFPTQGGRFFESEDFGIIDALSSFINNGRIKVFTIDSIDFESWSNQQAHPADRGKRYEAYENYILDEVLPLIRNHCHQQDIKVCSGGFSMGAYHAANFFFKHPEQFDAVIAISGMYDLQRLVGDYMDQTVYFNSPLHFLQNLQDEKLLLQIRSSKIIIAVGQGAWEQEMIADTQKMQQLLNEKQIAAWIDFWGSDVSHDWPWWRKMMPYFVDKIGV